MRPLRLLASFAIFAATSTGCAAISGLDKLEKVDCTSDCEAGASDATQDVTVGDAHNDISLIDVAIDSADMDSGVDVGNADTSSDAPSDTPADTATDARDAAADAPPVDCGVPNTINNCAACGNACDTTNSNTPSCNGTTCSYASCKAGHSNCSQTAPDLAGCECATPGCCAGNACQTTHTNGVGNNFYDCLALDTYNQAQALAACVALTGNQAQCTNAGCLAPDGGASGNVVCSSGSATQCVCWQYDAPFAGRYFTEGMPGVAHCFCPGSINAFQWH